MRQLQRPVRACALLSDAAAVPAAAAAGARGAKSAAARSTAAQWSRS